jgi:uncharacterized protein YciI
MEFDQFTLVLLYRPPDAPELSEAEADAIQDGHLANQADLYDQGLLVASGPFSDQEDESLRGLALMTVSPERARELYSIDPAVKAGRLAVQAMTWLTPAGGVRFEHVRHPRSIADVLGE